MVLLSDHDGFLQQNPSIHLGLCVSVCLCGVCVALSCGLRSTGSTAPGSSHREFHLQRSVK